MVLRLKYSDACVKIANERLSENTNSNETGGQKTSLPDLESSMAYRQPFSEKWESPSGRLHEIKRTSPARRRGTKRVVVTGLFIYQ